jgi:MerR family transcriptional regulator, light-induced transcriptional regulator
MEAPGDDCLDLDDVAEQVGVHYQTVYRWVRAGKLPAAVVSGRYCVKRRELDKFLGDRNAPTRPKPPSEARLNRAAEKMHAALSIGDDLAACDLARSIVAERTPVAELIQKVLVPPLRRIGQDWYDGKLAISVEHRASAIVERILGEAAPRPRGRRRGSILVAAVSGDRHSLATTMAAVTLREKNWFVHHLGADMPPDELVRFCKENRIDVAVLTLVNAGCTQLAHATGARIEAAGTPAIIGGAGRTLDELVQRVQEVAKGGDGS